MRGSGASWAHTEADLVVLLTRHLAALTRPNLGHTAFAREVAVGRRIADIVLLNADAELLTIPRRMSAVECTVVSQLRANGNSMSVATIRAACGIDVERDRRKLRRLTRSGVLTTVNGVVTLRSNVFDAPATLTALEAKISDWRGALTQALRYREYADLAYVVLPALRAHTPQRFAPMFTASGVGLLALDQTGLREIFPAQAKRPEFGWKREFVYSRLVDGQPVPPPLS